MRKADRAEELFSSGHNCAQAVLMAFGPDVGVSETTCLKLAAPFGGGLARTGNTCGALSGALLAYGLLQAPEEATPAAKDAVYGSAGALMRRFVELHGSTMCRELLGCDLSTAEGRAYAREHDLHHTRCAAFVRSATELVEEAISQGH